MKFKQPTLWVSAIFLGVIIGFYVYTKTMEKAEIKRSTSELYQWMPNADALKIIQDNLDPENHAKIRNLSDHFCHCAELHESALDRYAWAYVKSSDGLDNDLSQIMNIMPFMKCLEMDIAPVELATSTMTDKAKTAFLHLGEKMQKKVPFYLILIEMSDHCKKQNQNVTLIFKQFLQADN